MYKKLSPDSSGVLMRYVLSALMLLCAGLSAAERSQGGGDLITVESDLNDKLVQIVRDNAAACFNSLNETYFQLEPDRPLRIYLSATAAQSRKLLEDHGHTIEAGNPDKSGFYVPSVPAVYAYITAGDDGKITLEPLFASIAEHFVTERFSDAPEWFRLGLISFFSKNAQIIDGKLVPAESCPRAGLVLRAEVQTETRLNIKKLYISSDERFHEWSSGPAFVEAFFCWMQRNGHLASYIQKARQKGYELEVLEETTGVSAGKINIDLKKFIEGDCWTAAYLAEAEDAQDPNAKEKLLQTALESKPDYAEAQLALAKLYYQQGRGQLCQKALMPILSRPESPDLSEFAPAARLAATVLYDQTNYAQARDYYQKAWEKSDYYIYKYQIAYKLANCCHYLNEPEAARQWYGKFIESNFQPEQDQAAVAYAQKYIETFSPKEAGN
jgi:tetratricopeptide (TPR) repeat protein